MNMSYVIRGVSGMIALSLLAWLFSENKVGFFLHITAMLVVLVSLIHLVNLLLGLVPDLFGAPVTMQRCLGYVMAALRNLT